MAGVLALVLLLGGCASSTWEAEALDAGEVTTCDACAGPADGDERGARWPDDRITCGECRDDAVIDRAEAEDVFVEAQAELRDLLDLEGFEGARPRLRLVDRPRLQRLATELTHPDLRAFTEVLEVVRGDVVESRRFTIYVLLGLPRECLLGILCHELFHVWQTLRGGVRPDADLVFREGAAQYVQYRVLDLRGSERWTRRLLKNQDPVYGVGLRRFLALVEDRGERPAIELGATRDRFPPGF